jgi:AcrR family transcriptional regulator
MIYEMKNQKQLQSEHTRQQIIEAATRLFARKGFYGTSISDLTEAVGLTKGALYHHFKDKDDIFFAVVDSVKSIWEKSVGNEIGTEKSALKKLSRLFENHAAMIGENEFLCLAMSNLMSEMESINPRFSSELEEIYEALILFVHDIVLQGQQSGEIRPDADAMLLSLNIVGILKSIGCYPKLKCFPIDRSAMAHSICESLFDGIKGA